MSQLVNSKKGGNTCSCFGRSTLLLSLMITALTLMSGSCLEKDDPDISYEEVPETKMYYEGTVTITGKGIYKSSDISIDEEVKISGAKYEEWMDVPGVGLEFPFTDGFIEIKALNVSSEGAIICQFDGTKPVEDLHVGFGWIAIKKDEGTYDILIQSIIVPGEEWMVGWFDINLLKDMPLPDNNGRPLVLRGEKTWDDNGVIREIKWDLTRHYYQ